MSSILTVFDRIVCPSAQRWVVSYKLLRASTFGGVLTLLIFLVLKELSYLLARYSSFALVAGPRFRQNGKKLRVIGEFDTLIVHVAQRHQGGECKPSMHNNHRLFLNGLDVFSQSLS